MKTSTVKSKKQGWIWFTILVILFISISLFAATQKPKSYPQYVSESPAPAGVKAFYTYLSKHYEVAKWSNEPSKLMKTGNKNLIIMVEPFFIPDSKQMKSYQDFVEDGNTLLLLSKDPTEMFDVETEWIDDETTNGADGLIYDQDKKGYIADVRPDLRLLPSKTEEVLLFDDEGAIALKRTVGKGEIVVALAPDWMTNSSILTGDHLPLLLKMLDGADPKSILFDEYVHSGTTGPSSLSVYPKWFLFILLQAIVITLLWLWIKGKRFGPIVINREETVRFSDESIRALTAWFLRGGRYHDSLFIQIDYVKLLLQERWGIPYNKEWYELSSYLEKKWNREKPSEIQSFLSGIINILEKEKLTKQEYLLWSRKVDQLRKEVEG